MATHFRKKKVEAYRRQTLFEHTTQIYQNPMENEDIRHVYTKTLQWFVKIDVDINSVTENKIFKFYWCVFLRKLYFIFIKNLMTVIIVYFGKILCLSYI